MVYRNKNSKKKTNKSKQNRKSRNLKKTGGDEIKHIIGTYNMSFFSDWGFNPLVKFPSEYAFLYDTMEEGQCKEYEKEEDNVKKENYIFQLIRENKFNPRQYWENSLRHLEKFIKDKRPSMVALQEMNKTDHINKENLNDKPVFYKYDVTNFTPKATEPLSNIDFITQNYIKCGEIFNRDGITEDAKKDLILLELQNMGSNAIETMLDEVNKECDTAYTICCDEVIIPPYGFFGERRIGLAIIWDQNKLGKYSDHKIVDLTFKQKIFNNEYEQRNGQPILMVKTNPPNIITNLNVSKSQSNNLLVSYHGSQDPRIIKGEDFSNEVVTFNKYMEEINSKFIIEQIKNYLGKSENLYVKNIFIGADLNDRYDSIKTLKFNEKLSLSYEGEAPKACCYNFDSSSSLDITEDKGKILTTENNNSKFRKYKLPTKESMDKEDAKINNYFNRGDKVFGQNPSGNIEIYDFDSRRNNRSTESDHELVYATFNNVSSQIILSIEQNGGKNNNKSRKSKRSNKNKKRSNLKKN
jgi:hypothetical protein